MKFQFPIPPTLRTLPLLCALGLAAQTPTTARADLCFRPGERVLWLGDSVTAGGRHIAYIDAYLRARWPDADIHFMNCGLASETASGLSEAHHPWPRPCVHERLDRVIEKLEFDWAVVCYGINDGIYAPFSDENFAAYRDGMSRAVEQLHAAGAKVILLSPMPFDAPSVGGKLLPAGGGDYGFKTPFAGYNDVMLRYAGWVRDYGGPAELKVDITTPVTDAIAARRAADPGFDTGDGVHPNPEGSHLIAKVLLESFGVPRAEFAEGLDFGRLLEPDLPDAQREIVALALQRDATLAVAYREHVGHKRPGAPENPPSLEGALAAAEGIEAAIRKLAEAE